ncbi:WD40 repeat-like protein [Coemansia reversa NRRL 1564]|uniref:WD40 repeat-like protein n=1 Tax=Coemansia reversa (strain ATCC 12441 / NRRL 1564) TaxID=763665 RepID=A0A2G5BDS5_COERN|nr:WD40 repeat-like protein [Coemansia reversa NRRL 1564]|eukprot:PIA17170.1 WD40 repeat-like protein [Coemansia reversa NRRL 1564]
MHSHTKIRTSGALLAVYLNLEDTSEFHSPDPKVQPVLETWVNPHTLPNQPRKSDVVAQNLVDQFGQIASQVIYKPLVDRSFARLKEYCIHYRNTVDDERIMFYYNGHGMPLPTSEGDFWVRQRQYNPQVYTDEAKCVSLGAETLSQWIGSPCVYVWDCANAMKIVHAFEKHADIQGKNKAVVDLKMVKLALCNSGRCEDIHFAATGPDEQLPTEPKLPADLFTACLTTPAKAMIRYWLLRNPNVSKVIQDNWEKLPGTIQDRYTPMGEINWIITTITDTIAWSTLPPDQFNKMFRGDVVVASLYRNFMLADRIMRFYGVHPQCSPTMPSTHNHPLWNSLDMEIELCLAQLPRLLAEDKQLLCTSAVGYTPSSFFVRQLRAFDMWLQHTAVPPNIELPLELPIILQMLLSRKYCINALILLYRFTILGPWAVSMVTAVGAYSYLTRLLSSQTSEVREILTLIWARLVAVDTTLKPLLLKSRGFEHFIAYLGSHVHFQSDSVSEKARVRDNVLAAGAFTLTIMCKDTQEVQKTCFYKHLLDYLLTYLHQPDNGTDERATFRVWILMCLAELWKGYPQAKLLANVQDLLIQMALHRLPVVRAAAIRAMGTLIEDLPQLESNPGGLSIISSVERKIYGLLLHAASDGSPMVRREVVCVIGASVFGTYMTLAIEVVTHVVNKETQRHHKPQSQHTAAAPRIEAPNELLVHKTRLDLLVRLYKVLLELSTDAHIDVSLPAREACDALMRFMYPWSCSSDQSSLEELPRSKPLIETPPTIASSPLPARSISPINISTIDQHRRLISVPLQLPKPEIFSTYGYKSGRINNTGNAERAEARQKLVEIEEAWQEWCRHELRENICESTLLDWAGAYFTEFDISLFANVNGPLQGSLALVESCERNRRIERMETSARTMGTQAGSMKWMDVRAVASNRDPASVALLHPLEPHAIVASRKGTVSVYDWELAAQVGHYSIGPQGSYGEASSISSLHLINPLGHSKLLVGTRDGKVRIFASHVPDFDPDASFIFAGARIYGEQEECGLVTAWNQRSSVLFAGGNDKEVRVWDVSTEMCIEEIPVVSMGGITCVSHDGVSGNIFAVGNASGLVRVMDRRLDARSGAVASWREHSPDAIRNVAMRPGQTEIISASSNGSIKYWDLRHRESVFTIADTHTGCQLEHMIPHQNMPVLMTSSNATVKLWNQRGKNIGNVSATKQPYGSLKKYMKTLAGYPNQPKGDKIYAAAMHSYLPMALIVTENGNVNCIWPSKTDSLSSS